MMFDAWQMADVVAALQMEIDFLTNLDPYDPNVPVLQERLDAARGELERSKPGGV